MADATPLPSPALLPNLQPATRNAAAEAALHNGLLFAALAPSPLSMVVADPLQPGYPVVFANQRFLEMTGYAAAEVIGRSCRFLQGPETDPQAIAAMRAAIGGGRSLGLELLNYRRDGTPFWNALSLSPIVDGAGRLRWFLGSQMDVTRRRDAEAALRQARMLEAMGQLTGGIAHEFNNLLTVLAGNLEMLEGASDVARQQRHAARMREAVARARSLTNRLLAFARRQPLERRRIDGNALLAALAERARAALGPTITLHLRLQPTLHACRADQAKLEAALWDLVINARDAMPTGGCITLASADHPVGPDSPEAAQDGVAPGGYVALSVADTGAGMPPAVLGRASEPFFTTKESGRATGLGLSTVHGFARQSRGHLRLRSRPGEGTEARLLLPALGVAAADHAAAPSGGGAGTMAGNLSSPMARRTVLLLDSDPERLEAAMATLDGLGYRVLGAGTVAEALALLQGETPVDLLLAAGGKPGLDAATLTAEACRRRPSLRVGVTPSSDMIGAAVRLALETPVD